MKKFLTMSDWAGGVQWLFFMFANTVVIPITIGAAFDLSDERTTALMQISFLVTGLACVLQGVLGHRRTIMEGQSGLWWGVILTLVATSTAQGMSLEELGGSLALGIFISAGIMIFVGLSGLGPHIAKLFNSGVMGVFMFLLGCQLVQIFMKGMLGLPFGNAAGAPHIKLAVSLVSIVIAIVVIIISRKAPVKMRSYAILIGILFGWLLYVVVFGVGETSGRASLQLNLFPLGTPTWQTGVIVTAVLSGLLNLANTFGALKGMADLDGADVTKKMYRWSFTVTGIFNGIAGLVGLVPYAPYVSSIGFLRQINIYKMAPFLLGGVMFFIMGLVPVIGSFFSMLPLSVGSAVLFVAYLQMFNSAWDFIKKIKLDATTVYRVAIPIFVGIIIMTMPESAFETIPVEVRPLVSSGLLVGIFLSLILENVFKWEEN